MPESTKKFLFVYFPLQLISLEKFNKKKNKFKKLDFRFYLYKI